MKKLPIKLPLKLPQIKIPPFFNQLQKRDRLAIICAATAIGVFIIAKLMIFPIFGNLNSKHSLIKSKRQQLVQMYSLKAEAGALSKSSSNIKQELKNRPKGFTLFSFLDDLAGKTGIKSNIVSMKPSNTQLKNSSYVLSMVEIKVQSVTMEQLVNFLHGVENSRERMWVRSMTITKRTKNQGLISSILKVETYQL
ncbi:MAG: hypothetical protein GY874_02185 [Desulfobacteraceae bacterium]|nr:hypothetical protein [Desulfobacteraceae bacterium]